MYSIKNKTTEYSIMRKPPSVGTQSIQAKGRSHFKHEKAPIRWKTICTSEARKPFSTDEGWKLLYSYGFCKVSWLVYVVSSEYGYVVCQKLQCYGNAEGSEFIIDFRYLN